ncbi:DUF2490 domain-containing protein [Flavobacteriaceae bacterium TP-CH-4]|uniref:DUF2490 domain-containing protein n=1 Tax=Pelagihabitans pacificus TaxID=2696054 RepID=A0A967AR95_9FLAO|nr:DUF2490 domain-containing protein [Pelagihabitans pacificus]NHF58704.1 DUF2490 domain-containing protein [Pelagihabitans pacificus]
MYCIRGLFLWGSLLVVSSLMAQNNYTGYIEPDISVNYEAATNYDHNFKISTRTYFYDEGAYGLRSRQIDLVHFSKLKIRVNQSLAIGLQYRFRELFENDRENELRLTQQYNGTSKPSVIRFGHRVRSEQRIQSSITIHRFRYRFALDFPLRGEQLDIGEPYLIGSTETLLSVAKSNRPQYDHRFTVSLGALLSKETRIQAGMEYRFEDYIGGSTQEVFFILSSLILSF